MTLLQITSVAAPLDRPGVLQAALGLVRRALGLGLLADREPIERLDLALIQSIAREASSAGVGQDAAVALMNRRAGGTAERLESLIVRLDGALADSPMPARELHELLRVYDHDGLAALVGTSVASLRRYAGATRTVPDAVADRVHFVALVTADLAGSYNEFGLRRWWERPRVALGGRSPRAALGSDWTSDGEAATAVAALAASLVGIDRAS
jgi:hypothetical protein